MQAAVDNWDRHWRDFGAASELSPSSRYRRSLAIGLLAIPPRERARVLDIGSGTGELAEELYAYRPNSSFLGIELSAEGVEIATRRVPRARFIQQDLLVDAAPAMDFRATHAVCSDVLEHLDDPAALLRNASAYMAPNCWLVVTVPGGWFNQFYRHIGHRRHYTPAELSSLLEGAGFTVVNTYAAGFPFFNLYRALITLGGRAFVRKAAGPPSMAMRVASVVFNALFRLNLDHPWGWQTAAVALYRPSFEEPDIT